MFKASSASNADPRLGGCSFLAVAFAFGHVEANLLVGESGSGHENRLFYIRFPILKPGQLELRRWLAVYGSNAAFNASPPAKMIDGHRTSRLSLSIHEGNAGNIGAIVAMIIVSHAKHGSSTAITRIQAKTVTLPADRSHPFRRQTWVFLVVHFGSIMPPWLK